MTTQQSSFVARSLKPRVNPRSAVLLGLTFGGLLAGLGACGGGQSNPAPAASAPPIVINQPQPPPTTPSSPLTLQPPATTSTALTTAMTPQVTTTMTTPTEPTEPPTTTVVATQDPTSAVPVAVTATQPTQVIVPVPAPPAYPPPMPIAMNGVPCPGRCGKMQSLALDAAALARQADRGARLASTSMLLSTSGGANLLFQMEQAARTLAAMAQASLAQTGTGFGTFGPQQPGLIGNQGALLGQFQQVEADYQALRGLLAGRMLSAEAGDWQSDLRVAHERLAQDLRI